MNDIRRTILWVIFGFSMVLLWDQWQVYNGHKATFFPTPGQTTAASTTNLPQVAGVPVAGASSTTTVPAGTAPSTAQVPGISAPATAVAPRERIVVSTDVLKLTFDTEGGSLVQTEFVKHIDMANKVKNFVLLDESKERTYVAQSGLIAGATGGTFPTHKVVMTAAAGERVLKDGNDELVVKFESPEVSGVKLDHQFIVAIL